MLWKGTELTLPYDMNFIEGGGVHHHSSGLAVLAATPRHPLPPRPPVSSGQEALLQVGAAFTIGIIFLPAPDRMLAHPLFPHSMALCSQSLLSSGTHLRI